MGYNKGKKTERKKRYIVGKSVKPLDTHKLFVYAETLSQMMSPLDKLGSNIDMLVQQGSIHKDDARPLQIELYKKINPLRQKYTEIIEELNERVSDDTGIAFSINDVEPFLTKLVKKNSVLMSFYGMAPEKKSEEEE